MVKKRGVVNLMRDGRLIDGGRLGGYRDCGRKEVAVASV